MEKRISYSKKKALSSACLVEETAWINAEIKLPVSNRVSETGSIGVFSCPIKQGQFNPKGFFLGLLDASSNFDRCLMARIDLAVFMTQTV